MFGQLSTSRDASRRVDTDAPDAMYPAPASSGLLPSRGSILGYGSFCGTPKKHHGGKLLQARFIWRQVMPRDNGRLFVKIFFSSQSPTSVPGITSSLPGTRERCRQGIGSGCVFGLGAVRSGRVAKNMRGRFSRSGSSSRGIAVSSLMVCGATR